MSTQEPIKQNHVGFKRNADGKFEPYLAGSIPATIVGGVEQTAPRVTIEQIEAEIESEHYFTAWDGVMGELASDGVLPTVYENDTTAPCLQRTMFCVLTLNNGMRVEGVNHGSVSAANYSVEYGRKDARAKAIDKLWPMFGFEMAQKLYREKQEAGDGLVTMRVNPEALHQAEDAEAIKMNLDAASVPTENEQGLEYSLWGRVQVFAGMNTNEPTLSSLGSSDS